MTIEEINELTMEQVEARKAEIKAIVDDKSSEADFAFLASTIRPLTTRSRRCTVRTSAFSSPNA